MSYKEGCLYVFGLRSVAYLTCETSQQNADIHKKKKRWEHNGNLKPEQTKTVSWITITLKNGQRKELQSKALISMYFLSLPVKNLRRVWGPIRSLKTRSRKGMKTSVPVAEMQTSVHELRVTATKIWFWMRLSASLCIWAFSKFLYKSFVSYTTTKSHELLLPKCSNRPSASMDVTMLLVFQDESSS